MIKFSLSMTVLASALGACGNSNFGNDVPAAPIVAPLPPTDPEVPQAGAACYDIPSKYASMGTQQSYLGNPVSGVISATDGVGSYQQFEHGAIYELPGHSCAHELHGNINDYFQRLGGLSSPLGYPLSDINTAPDGDGHFAHFQHGSAFWTSNYGSHIVIGDIRNRWAAMGWQQSYLGYPTSDEQDFSSSSSRVSYFQNGAIVFSAGWGAHDLRMDALQKWQQAGGASGPMGQLVSNEQSHGNGAFWNDFEHGQVWRHPNFGVHALVGGIADVYRQLGQDQGSLGFPTADQVPMPDGVGFRQQFQNGSIFWNEQANAFAASTQR